MKTIKGYVESAGEDNWSVYAEELPVWGFGETEEEAKDDFKKCFHEQALEIASKTNNTMPSWYDKNTEFLFTKH